MTLIFLQKIWGASVLTHSIACAITGFLLVRIDYNAAVQ